jgi:L-lysine 6-transaminase
LSENAFLKQTPGDKTQSKGGTMTTQVLSRISPETVHETLAQTMMVDGLDMVLDLERSKGAWLYDARTKRYMLDFFTFVSSAPVGANHPKVWNDKAFLEKLLYAAIVNPSNSDAYSVEMAEFVETFRQLAMPKGMKHVFWIAGGALAVENALKAAFDWKVRKNFRKGYKFERGHHVIYFKEAFHGRSGYTLSLTNTDPVKTALFPKFAWTCINNPKITFPLTDERLAELERIEREAIEHIKQTFVEHKDDVAAIIIEPIQGEGGDNHFRREFFQALRVLSLENEAMLIFDEVQTGIGLTGTMWAAEQVLANPVAEPCKLPDGITCSFRNEGGCTMHEDLCLPDMIAFGKKTQVCGFMASARIDEIEDNVFRVPSRINSTWGGNLVDMLRCKKYLEIIEEDRLLENVRTVGIALLQEIQLLAEDFIGIVTNPRGRGLMCAFDLRSKSERDAFIKRLYQNGLLMLGCGERSVRFRPPLNLTMSEMSEGINIIRQTLEEMFF